MGVWSHGERSDYTKNSRWVGQVEDCEGEQTWNGSLADTLKSRIYGKKSVDSLRGEVCTKSATAEFTRICYRVSHSLVNPDEILLQFRWKSITSFRNGSQRVEMKYEVGGLGSTLKIGEQPSGNSDSLDKFSQGKDPWVLTTTEESCNFQFFGKWVTLRRAVKALGKLDIANSSYMVQIFYLLSCENGHCWKVLLKMSVLIILQLLSCSSGQWRVCDHFSNAKVIIVWLWLELDCCNVVRTCWWFVKPWNMDTCHDLQRKETCVTCNSEDWHAFSGFRLNLKKLRTK